MQDDSVRIRKQWQPVIQAMISAADWGGKYVDEVEPFLAELEQKETWQSLGAIFRRIIAGERDPKALLAALDPVGVIVAGDVLRALGVAVSDSFGMAESQDLTSVIEEIFHQVVLACKPDTPLVYLEQMYNATQKMAEHPKLDPELRALGRALNQLLAGERAPDLAGLSPVWAMRVRELLNMLAS